MRKASRIMSIVAAILAFIACVEYLSTGTFLLLAHGFVKEGIEDLMRETSDKFIYDLLSFLYHIYWNMTITSFIYAFLCVFYGIILLSTLNSNSKGMYIFKIVFGVFMSRIGLVGAILGLIAHEREESRKVVEVIEK